MQSLQRKCLRYSIIGKIRQQIRLCRFQRRWIREHADTDTVPMNIFPENIVSVGRESYGELNVVTFSDQSRLIIGNYVSIAQNVTFLLDVEHYLDHVSTFPFKVKILGTEIYESFSKGDICVRDDVWIGYGATIMSGITIGQGAVIGAHAFVNRDVPPYAVVAGIPAKIVKYRSDEETIRFMEEINYDCLDRETIQKHIDELYEKIDNKESLERMTWLFKY